MSVGVEVVSGGGAGAGWMKVPVAEVRLVG